MRLDSPRSLDVVKVAEPLREDHIPRPLGYLAPPRKSYGNPASNSYAESMVSMSFLFSSRPSASIFPWRCSTLRPPTTAAWNESLIDLANRSRVSIKATGFYRESNRGDHMYDDLDPIIRELGR